MLERNRRNLEAALVKARRVVNAINRNDREAARQATESLVFDLIRTLDDDAREQLLTNALFTAVQFQDQLNAVRAFAGTRKRK